MTALESPALAFPCSWDASEHRRANRAAYDHRVRSTWDRLRLPLFAVWLLAILTPAVFLPDHWGYLRDIAPWAGLALLWFVTWHFVWPYLNSRQVTKNDPDAQDGYTRYIEPAGFRIQGRSSSVALAWDRIARVVETPEFFLFYFGPKSAYYLPRRAVPRESLAGLRARLHQLLDSSKLTFRADAS